MVNGELALKASDWINQQRCLHYKAMAQRESNDLSSNMLSREEIFKIMRVKPVRQMINGVDYFYSLLAKKNKKFILTNMRFLLIKGIESISYARDPGKDIKVPFLSVYELPNPKDTIDL